MQLKPLLCLNMQEFVYLSTYNLTGRPSIFPPDSFHRTETFVQLLHLLSPPLNSSIYQRPPVAMPLSCIHSADPPLSFPMCTPPPFFSLSLPSIMTFAPVPCLPLHPLPILAHSNPLPSYLLFTQALQSITFPLCSKPSFGQRLFGVTLDSLPTVPSY